MKAMYKPAVVTGVMDEGFSLASLPKFDAISTDYSVKIMAMRIAGLAGMLAMGALIIAL